MELNSSIRPSGFATAARTMPAFAAGTHAFQHSVDSALVSLAALGIAPHRIQLRRAGRQGAATGSIVGQRPAAGQPLTPGTLVELDVAGLGFSHALPVGMWDSGGEAEAGTREILEAFDDPLEKLKHWFHEGAPLFRIAPDDPAANARWLALFGVDATEWPRPMWFRLASLIARMGQLSCSQSGCAFVLHVLLDLPVQSFRNRPTETELPPEARSKLGGRSSRLGVDTLLGSSVEELATLVMELGPVPLEIYERFAESEEGAGLLRRVLHLLMPCSTLYEVTWSVQDRNQAPRLGIAGQNARLGINTHMGGKLGEAPAEAVDPLVVAGPDLELEDVSALLAEITKGSAA